MTASLESYQGQGSGSQDGLTSDSPGKYRTLEPHRPHTSSLKIHSKSDVASDDDLLKTLVDANIHP